MRKLIISLVLIFGMVLITSCATPQPVLQQATTTTGGTAATVQTTTETTTESTEETTTTATRAKPVAIAKKPTTTKRTTTAKPTTTTGKKTTATTKTEKYFYNMGEPANYHYLVDGYEITVLNAYTITDITTGGSPGYYLPDDGYVFLVVEVKLKNNNNQESIFPYLSLSDIISQNGGLYNSHFAGIYFSNNIYYTAEKDKTSIIPGAQVVGSLVYEIPVSHGDLTLRFPTESLHNSGNPYFYFRIPNSKIDDLFD